MAEIIVEILHAATFELRREYLLRLLQRLGRRRHLVRQKETLTRVTLQGLAHHLLRLAAMIHPRRIEVVDAVRIGVVQHLQRRLLVDGARITVSADRRETHAPETQKRHLVAVAHVAAQRDAPPGRRRSRNLRLRLTLRRAGRKPQRPRHHTCGDAAQSLLARHTTPQEAVIYVIYVLPVRHIPSLSHFSGAEPAHYFRAASRSRTKRSSSG